MSERAVLLLESLSVARGGRLLVEDLRLALRPGERALIRGGNGSGKTSLVLTVCGLLAPAGGTVTLPARLGYVPQEPRFPTRLRVADYLRQLAALGGARAAELEDEVEDALVRFQLGDAGHERIGSLSRGWRQRLNLARGWLGQPEAIVLDEPQTALDPDGMESLRHALEAPSAPAILLVAPPAVGCDDLAPLAVDLGSHHGHMDFPARRRAPR